MDEEVEKKKKWSEDMKTWMCMYNTSHWRYIVFINIIYYKKNNNISFKKKLFDSFEILSLPTKKKI